MHPLEEISKGRWYVVMRVFGLTYPGISAPNTTLFGPLNVKEQSSRANYVVSADNAGVVRRSQEPGDSPLTRN